LKSKKLYIIAALVVLLLLFFVGLFLGSELLSPGQVLEGLFEESKLNFIIREIRLPRVLTAILSGAALSVGGLLMQSYFRNALAGPYILGISAGGGLGVAIFLMAGSLFVFDFSVLGNTTIVFSIIGSALTLGLIMLLSRKIGNGPMLLIAGLMIGSFASAMVSVLQFFAPSDTIKRYLLWTMGSLTAVDMNELMLFGGVIFAFLVLAMFFANGLNAFLLGETQAQSLGVSSARIKWMVMIITGVLAGIVTAYCGPIAFVGLTAPHLSRLILKSQNHHYLIPFSAILGAVLLLFCDIVAQLPGLDLLLPINAVTSLIGAPIVVFIILKSKVARHG
jgi:iron complex transport system permease protein